jgi:predicted Zn-ribbon and HTH transcriptional regulator
MASRTITQCQCLRCGHRWWPRQAAKTRKCPSCNSPYWDRPITRPGASSRLRKQK